MAAESDLGHQPLFQCPVEQRRAIALHGPAQMLLPVDAMDGQVVELGYPQPFQSSLELPLSFRKGAPRNDLAGDDPATLRFDSVLMGVSQGRPKERFGRAIGRCCLNVIDAGGHGRLQHRRHLLDGCKRTHGAEGEETHRPAMTKGASQSWRSRSSWWSPRVFRCRTRAAGLRSSTKRLKAL